jgi:hypothetical protein
MEIIKNQTKANDFKPKQYCKCITSPAVNNTQAGECYNQTYRCK